jgi:TetR/AcrR family transcriptional regulator
METDKQEHTEKALNTKKKIIDAAFEVLQRKEMHECVIDEIAKAAGVGKGTVYLYFKSKSELYSFLMMHMVDEMKAVIDSAKQSDSDPVSKIKKLVAGIDEYMSGRSQLFLMVREQAKPSDNKEHEKMHKVFEEMLFSIGDIIKEGISKGKLRDLPPVFVGALIFSSLTSAHHYRKRARPGAKKIDAELITDIILRGIEKNGK